MSKKEIPGKCSSSETEHRIKRICELKLEGFTRHHILQYAEQTWKIREDRTDQLIGKANQRIKELNTVGIQENMALVVSNLWDLYREARMQGDRKSALTALAQISKIKGLEQITINHNLEPSELMGLTNEDLDKLLIEGHDNDNKSH